MKNSKSSTISFHIAKQTNQNTKYFVYGDQNKKFSINFDLLKNNCNYFYRNRKQFKELECINLFNEEEERGGIKMNEETIKAFIASCQNEECNIKLSSILGLQYLAYKYEYPGLKTFTDECIKQHSKELIIQKILFNPKEINLDEETFISKNFERYIEDDEILQLPISTVYRIFEKYKANNFNTKKVINFLFKCLDHYGKDASILFNEVDFEEENFEVVNRLLTKYSSEFDFNMINSTMAKTTMKLSSELTKQKEEHLKIFSEMERTISNEKSEIIKLRKEEERNRIIEKSKYDDQIKEYEDNIKKLDNELKERMINIEKEFKTMHERYETTISNGKMKIYQNIILEMLKYEDFMKLSDELREHIVEDIFENQQNAFKINNQFYQKILFLCKLFQILISEDQEKHIKPLYKFNKSTLLKFVIDQLKEIKMSSNILEKLSHENIQPQMFKYMISKFEHISIEIEYPTKSFQSSSKFLQYIIKEIDDNLNKIKITLIIKATPEIEEMKIFQNMIDFVKIEKSMKEIKNNLFKKFNKLKSIQFFEEITMIGDNSFEGCESLTKISIPPSVNSIGNSAFKNCSTLTEIIIPTSIKSIGDNAFEGCTSLTEISIPSSVNLIGKSVFEGIKTINLSKSMTTIPPNLFNGCSALTEITIPTSIKSIGDNAFEGCTSLREISIPPSVNFIGKSVFKGCSLSIINLFSYNQDKELAGIINYLTHKTGGNIHDNGTIKISASSTDNGKNYDPKNLCNLTDLSKNSMWAPKNEPNSTLLFDFKNRAIKLTNYTFHTGDFSGDNPKSWVVECSNDLNQWFSVDIRNNEQILYNNKNVCHTFKCQAQSEKYYQYIRIKSTDTSWNGYNYFDLVAVEFFGSLKEKIQ